MFHEADLSCDLSFVTGGTRSDTIVPAKHTAMREGLAASNCGDKGVSSHSQLSNGRAPARGEAAEEREQTAYDMAGLRGTRENRAPRGVPHEMSEARTDLVTIAGSCACIRSRIAACYPGL